LIRRYRVIVAALSLVLVPFACATAAAVTDIAKTAPVHPVGKTTKPKVHKTPVRDPQVDHWINVAGFGAVAVYRPKAATRGLVLFASGDGGWNLGVTDMAHQAVAQGFWVAGFSTPQFLKGLDSSDAACSDANGLLAKLGQDLVRQLDLPLDTRPLVIGYSSGATVAYAALAADAGQRFGGGISLGFCPDLLIKKPFCAGPGGLTQQKQKQSPFGYVFDKRETINVPWRILQGEIDQVCDPKFAPKFAAGQKDAKAIMLPHVGHGFGAPKNWMRQYIQSVKDLPGSAPR
jgi:type IV secretory pathway VirJ component